MRPKSSTESENIDFPIDGINGNCLSLLASDGRATLVPCPRTFEARLMLMR